MQVTFGVLGPIEAWDDAGTPVALKGPKHRALLARLIAAYGRVVSVNALVDDLWEEPPAGAVSATRTFVAALRRALEPDRPPRAPARFLVSKGPGYALRTPRDSVDAWRFEDAVTAASAASPSVTLARLDEALGWWRGPAYAGLDDEPWARTERSRLGELRLTAVERRSEARIAVGRAADAVPELDAHVAEHPWREKGWRLLALALYRDDRQGDALAVLRRARDLLVEHLGIDPGPQLSRLETDILRHAVPVDADVARDPGADESAGLLWADATAAYARTVATGSRVRLETTVGLLRSLAVTGGPGLEEARRQRMATVTAAEQLDDPELTARVIGAYDVPGIWTRSDDPDQAVQVIAAAERTLARLRPDTADAMRARLLATIALESRGTGSARAAEAAREAERIARRLGDPTLLAFALNGSFMQAFDRAGRAPRRDEIGAELVALSSRHGLPTFEILGHLIQVQARGALADFGVADEHADAADRLAERHERPLAGVFTTWYRALRRAATGASLDVADTAYRDAATTLDGAGMPGVERGILPLARLCLRVWRGAPLDIDDEADWGPYEQWVRPLLLAAGDRPADATAALRRLPDPPRDLLYEAMWCLVGRAACVTGERMMMERARSELAPAADELAGAGSGMLTAGPVAGYLAEISTALERTS
ncbi:AfsR/SARP family transcriptional regulator [Phytoactinopolyspora halotolerans]|uniref:AfsR/SARP family transcriptional regulator n=1 Tax=Phytoactinopolyspora halotolerans TaxID=1981512 RepID=A0A6L9S5I9_9ACTN|nr:AfsR/SARP family transcriptional regulator [Phytoactinopolyspora halotolerans]NEE00426.1 AfsR/SARP family transcriptional regulator [Phytoactinopolyspora halotolerans]